MSRWIFFLLVFLLFPLFSSAEGGFAAKEILVQVFNFSIFFIALILFVRKPLGAFFHKRQKDFISFEEQALQMEKEKQKEKKEWDEKLKTLEKQEKGIQKKAQTEGERWLFQKREELKNLKIQLKKSAEFLIQLEREKAKRDLLERWRNKTAQSALESLKKPARPGHPSQSLTDFLKQLEAHL